MSLSVNREPVKNEEFVDEAQVLDEEVREPVVPVESGPKYYYLDDDPLSYEFSLDRDLTKTYTLHLVLYKMNQVLPLPFLEFYLEKSTNVYEFPHKPLDSEPFKHMLENLDQPHIEPADEDNQESPVLQDQDGEDIFIDQCFIFFKEKVGEVENLETMYKGFVEKDEHIFVVFDVDQVDTSQLKGLWATLDEIIVKKTVANVEVAPTTTDIFLENRVLANIKNDVGENLPYPTALYLCDSREEGGYRNSYYKEGESSITHTTLIHERINHPKLKQIYLFSETVLPADTLTSEIKRYALYIDPENKIGGELETIPEVPVVGFQEDGVDYWSTKSPKYFAEII
jgi:hypothetical protein